MGGAGGSQCAPWPELVALPFVTSPFCGFQHQRTFLRFFRRSPFGPSQSEHLEGGGLMGGLLHGQPTVRKDGGHIPVLPQWLIFGFPFLFGANKEHCLWLTCACHCIGKDNPRVFDCFAWDFFSRKHCEGFFRAELLVNLRRVACAESPAWRYQELLVNLRRVACAESPAWRYQHGDTRAELLAQSSLHRVTSMEILAQSHQHGDTCAESPAWRYLRRVTSMEPPA